MNEREAEPQPPPVSARLTDTPGHAAPPVQSDGSFRRETNGMNPLPRTADIGETEPDTGYRVGEAFCVTAVLLTCGIISSVAFALLLPAMAQTFGANIRTVTLWQQGYNFVASALTAVLVGGGVGLLAKQRTMIGSLVAANIAVAVLWQVYHVVLQRTVPALTQMPLWDVRYLLFSAFGILTGTLAQIGIALLVARTRPGRF